MLPCRVLYLLAILFCCVAVSGAEGAGGVEDEIIKELKNISDLAEQAVESVNAANTTRNKILQLKDQCNAAAEYATYLTAVAKEFVTKINQLVAKAETDPSVLETEKKEGVKLLENLKWAAAFARDSAVVTKETRMQTVENGETARNTLYDFKGVHEKLKNTYDKKNLPDQQVEGKKKKLTELHEKVEAAFPYTSDESLRNFLFDNIDVAEDAHRAALNAETILKRAQEADNFLQKALKKLEDALNAAKEKSKERPPQQNQGSSNNTGDQSAPSDPNSNQQVSPANTTAAPDSQEINSTTPPSTENTTSEAPTTTPSPVPVPNEEISTIIASTVQKNKDNVDSSVSPVWMRTAAPMLIVAVMFSFTVY